MRYLFFVISVFCLTWMNSHTAQAQSFVNRRANYFETFVEVNEPIDSLLIHKSKREMIAFHTGKKVKRYIISLGMTPEGKKEVEGDMKTPEGLYTIFTRDSMSAYHKNLGISYPNAADSLHALDLQKLPGGDIKIHGFPNDHAKYQEKEFLNTDWTLGCISVSDFEIDELFRWVIPNCPILILP